MVGSRGQKEGGGATSGSDLACRVQAVMGRGLDFTFFFLLHPRHTEVPRPGIEPSPQQ